jgi:beta-glucosidase/6-phospho-beta-glucosidase/beta-galactosidase
MNKVNSLLQKYLCELLKAMKDDGCKVIGCTLWSFMDNFEWMFGYT